MYMWNSEEVAVWEKQCVHPWWKVALWRGFLGAAAGKEPACKCRRFRFHPGLGKISWRRKWQPTPVFLPGKSHAQRSLVGYSPWGHKSQTLSH